MPTERSTSIHVPVMADEIVSWLNPRPGGVFVDGTLGGCGHARLLAERVVPGGRIIGLDRDPAAVQRAAALLEDLPVEVAGADFRELPRILTQFAAPAVDGVVLDLGLSSDQLADSERGFSFRATGELDLRFDPTDGEPAWKLIERLGERQLADLIHEYGEERLSRRIARRIAAARRETKIRTADELARVIRSCFPPRRHRIDPATRTFQALRIAVNDELGALREALEVIPGCLIAGGRLAVISFHSLEDRLVKRAFRDDDRYMILTKKPIRPNEAELRRNPRSRSARLRVAESR